jgi:hypothetical protein
MAASKTDLYGVPGCHRLPGKVDVVVLSGANTNMPQLSGPREVFSKAVEKDRRYSVGFIEGLNTVAMGNLNIDVQHALLVAEEPNDSKDNI